MAARNIQRNHSVLTIVVSSQGSRAASLRGSTGAIAFKRRQFDCGSWNQKPTFLAETDIEQKFPI
jgi:hypothetical protein